MTDWAVVLRLLVSDSFCKALGGAFQLYFPSRSGAYHFCCGRESCVLMLPIYRCISPPGCLAEAFQCTTAVVLHFCWSLTGRHATKFEPFTPLTSLPCEPWCRPCSELLRPAKQRGAGKTRYITSMIYRPGVLPTHHSFAGICYVTTWLSVFAASVPHYSVPGPGDATSRRVPARGEGAQVGA